MCVVHCVEDEKEAKAASQEGLWFVNKGAEVNRGWAEPGVKVPESYKVQVTELLSSPDNVGAEDYIKSGAFAMGDPDTCIEVMKRFQATGVDQVMCVMQMGHLPHTKVMDSIKLFGKHVIPHFQ